jgi:glycosyltransferase involved in cell wall biosynthesis
MSGNYLVSIVVIFLNAEKYLREAIESIISQTYEKWELLLVDDGSSDGSTEIARRYAKQIPARVRYLDHPGHRNCGKGASRNLGIRHAKGSYLAFLDADDIWLPHKLKEQVAILSKYENAGMLYGKTIYWHSWTQDPKDAKRDYIPSLGVPLDTPIDPPDLLPLYLRGKASIPCPTDILIRRSVADEIDGFDETFIGVNNIYEDQAFYAKLCIKTPVVVVDRCWDKYRQHSQASMAVAWQSGTEIQARRFFLEWLVRYLGEQEIQDRNVWLAVKKELWLYNNQSWKFFRFISPDRTRWIKKWLLRVVEYFLPFETQARLWSRK